MTLEELTEKAKKDSVLYHAIEKLYEKNSYGYNSFDNLKKVHYDVFTMKPIRTSLKMKKHLEENEELLAKALEEWHEISVINYLRDVEKEVLALIIYYMNEEIREKQNERLG